MKIDFKKLNGILEAKAGRAIDRLDGLKCYTDEFKETLYSIVSMLEVSKELEKYDTECLDCKEDQEVNRGSVPDEFVGQPYKSFKNEVRSNKRLVLFYSIGCEPCQYLKPILEDYIAEKGIELELVLIDDVEGTTHAREHNIQGWPTVFAVDQGIIVGYMVGADLTVPAEVTKHRIDEHVGKFF